MSQLSLEEGVGPRVCGLELQEFFELIVRIVGFNGHRFFSVFFFRFFWYFFSVLLGVASCNNSLDCAASQHWLRKYLKVLYFWVENVCFVVFCVCFCLA